MRPREGKHPVNASLVSNVVKAAACPFESRCPCRRGPWCRQRHGISAQNPNDYRMLSLEGCRDGRCERPCAMLQHVEELANEILDNAGIKYPPVPLDLIQAFDPDRPVEIRYISLSSHFGAVWLVNDAWVLHLNTNQPPAMNRYVAFHEGYHILCRLSAMHEGNTIDNCRPFNEAIADYFAASILMPRAWILEYWPRVHSIPEMAEIFQAPKSAVLSWIRRWIGPLDT